MLYEEPLKAGNWRKKRSHDQWVSNLEILLLNEFTSWFIASDADRFAINSEIQLPSAFPSSFLANHVNKFSDATINFISSLPLFNNKNLCSSTKKVVHPANTDEWHNARYQLLLTYVSPENILSDCW